MIPLLNTERLLLRGWQDSDLEAYASLRSDADLMALVSGGCRTEEQARAEFQDAIDHWDRLGYGTFVAVEKHTGAPVGYAGLWHPDDLDEPELCWSLFPGHTGKGYATEAADAALIWAATDLGLPPLMSFVHPDNGPSHAVALQLGAQRQADTTFRGAPRCFYRHRTVAD